MTPVRFVLITSYLTPGVTENHTDVTTSVEPVRPDSTAVTLAKDNNLNFKFHLVAGCFQVENNAVKFVATLQQQHKLLMVQLQLQ